MLLLKTKRNNRTEEDFVDTLNYQVAVFFHERQERPDKLWYKFSPAMDKVINQMPNIIPLPDDAPDEIPVVNAVSDHGEFTLNISRSRADLVINMDLIEKTSEPEEGLIKETAYQFALTFCELVDIKRIGIVGRFFLQEDNSVEKINKKFFENKFPNAVELSVRINNRDVHKGLILNNILEIQDIEQEKIETGEKRHGILVVRDINNVDNDDVLSKDKIENLIQHAFSCFSEDEVKRLL